MLCGNCALLSTGLWGSSPTSGKCPSGPPQEGPPSPHLPAAVLGLWPCTSLLADSASSPTAPASALPMAPGLGSHPQSPILAMPFPMSPRPDDSVPSSAA